MRKLIEIPPFTPDHHLRALSWKQPFADLMFHGKIETRTWDTKYRGWVLICASMKPYNYREILSITGDHQSKRASDTLGSDRRWLFNCGMAIGIGYLSDCREMTRADEDQCFVQYHSDLYCHVYEQVIPLSQPMPWKGSQGWREVPVEFKNTIYQLIQQ